MKALFSAILILLSICFCYPQSNKNINYSIGDSLHFRQNQQYCQTNDLVDLIKSKDSMYIRFSLRYPSGNMGILELKQATKKWKGRVIGIGESEFHKFALNFVLFGKYHRFVSKKKKELNYKVQYKFNPNDFFEIYGIESKDSIKPETIGNKLVGLPTQADVDTLKFNGERFIFEIEIATPNKYKYIYWEIPEDCKLNSNSTSIEDIYYTIFDLNPNYRDNKRKIYKKNRWP